MVKRKGVGYTIEAITSLMILFIFALGNTPSAPTQDWNQFQKKIEAKDLGHTLKKTGDLNNFLKRREMGSLKTAAISLSSGQLKVSGTVENLPIKKGSIGIHAKPSDIYTRDLRDHQTCIGDLEEIENEDGTIQETTNFDNPRVYVADTDPEIAGGNNNIDYDTIYVDNKTKCQFSPAEGPYYIDEFFSWDGTNNYGHYDFKNVTAGGDLLLYDADRAVRIRDTMKNDVAGVRTAESLDTFKLSEADLTNYNLLIFDGSGALNQINSNRDKLDSFMNGNPVLLLMDLGESDFESGFISDSGMEWIDLSFKNSPNPGIRFTNAGPSREVETYFEGMEGSKSNVDIGTGGKVSSSNGETVIDDRKFVIGNNGKYKIREWNATNRSMVQEDPANVEGEPDSACIEDGVVDSNFTRGKFDFLTYHGYQTGISPTTTYDVINTEMGASDTFCKDRNVRALNIDLNKNGDFSDEGEGPFLSGQIVNVENKSYKVIFPGTEAVRTGEEAHFLYNGDSTVEKINIRRSFRRDEIDKMARVPYRSSYNQDSRKLIAAVIYHLIGDSKEIKASGNTEISTSVYGSFNKETYLPYKISMRWR